MKKISLITILIMILSVGITLAACGGGNNEAAEPEESVAEETTAVEEQTETEEAKEKDVLAGTTYKHIEVDGTVVDESNITTITFNDDGTFEFKYPTEGDIATGTYEVKDNIISFTRDESYYDETLKNLLSGMSEDESSAYIKAAKEHFEKITFTLEGDTIVYTAKETAAPGTSIQSFPAGSGKYEKQ